MGAMVASKTILPGICCITMWVSADKGLFTRVRSHMHDKQAELVEGPLTAIVWAPVSFIIIAIIIIILILLTSSLFMLLSLAN